MRIYVPLFAMLLTTSALADEGWFQLITPDGEIARHAKIAIPDSDSDTQYFLTDSDGRVSLPAEPEALKGATLEFAGKSYSIGTQGLNFTDQSSIKRIIVDEQ